VIHSELQKIETDNGHPLSSTVYFPEGEIKAAILIVPAMGVTQKYYAAFASWLAVQGYLVATFDYFGTGQSQSSHLRDIQVTISDWAQFDCATMIKAISEQAQGKPLYWVGHSLGGQIPGLLPDHSAITKIVTIAAGSGYWFENVPSLKWRAWWLWYIVVPVATRLFGYFPGKRLRKVGNLPSGVMKQWRQWCLDPEYLVGVEGDAVRRQYGAVSVPISSISFTDDELMSKKNIESLHGFYSGAIKKMSRLSPDDIGVEHIGHFGFFKNKFEESLWRKYLLPELNES